MELAEAITMIRDYYPVGTVIFLPDAANEAIIDLADLIRSRGESARLIDIFKIENAADGVIEIH